jgi:hypothetical protein
VTMMTSTAAATASSHRQELRRSECQGPANRRNARGCPDANDVLRNPIYTNATEPGDDMDGTGFRTGLSRRPRIARAGRAKELVAAESGSDKAAASEDGCSGAFYR